MLNSKYHQTIPDSNRKAASNPQKTSEKYQDAGAEHRVTLPRRVYEALIDGKISGTTVEFFRRIESLSSKHGFCYASNTYLAKELHPNEDVRIGVSLGDPVAINTGQVWVKRHLKKLVELNLIYTEGGGKSVGTAARRIYPFSRYTEKVGTHHVPSDPGVGTPDVPEVGTHHVPEVGTPDVPLHTNIRSITIRDITNKRYPDHGTDHCCSTSLTPTPLSHADRVGSLSAKPEASFEKQDRKEHQPPAIAVASHHPPSMQDTLESAIERRKPEERHGLEKATRKMCDKLELIPSGEYLISQREDMEHIKLKPRELVSLIVGFKQRGLNGIHLEACCQHLSDYIANNRKGQQYKNHAAAIRNWVLNKVLKEQKFTLDLERSEVDLERSQAWLEKAMEG